MSTLVLKKSDIQALQYCSNLKRFRIYDHQRMLTCLEFPSYLPLPNLELFQIIGARLKYVDLSFLRDCPNITRVIIGACRVHRIILPAFDRHALLKEIILCSNFIESVDFRSPWNCPHLLKFDLSDNRIGHLDLSQLQSYPDLQILNLWRNKITSLDLIPLQHCSELQEINLRENKLTQIDLSPLQHCFNLQKLDLSHNHLTELDLSPLTQHPNLKQVNLEKNLLEVIDLTPLQSCPNIEGINVSNNPLIGNTGTS
ncbi:MAG: leucine-rich repeat domain-containing protein [Candidatus Hodarchaeota archaeon]